MILVILYSLVCLFSEELWYNPLIGIFLCGFDLLLALLWKISDS